MHIFFSGIGGSGIGPLALIAKQAGYEVSGSDTQESAYTHMLDKAGVSVHIGQTTEAIAKLHAEHPIDRLVYSSAVVRGNAQHPEIAFAEANHIAHSKRDELLNEIITAKHLKMVAVAGTHGKSTTTAMLVWLFHDANIRISHSVGAKLPFAPMGQYLNSTTYFVYEADEFDRNFLAYRPYFSVITGVAWDHHEIFPSRSDYNQAFKQFVDQSQYTLVWQQEATMLDLQPSEHILIANQDDHGIRDITLHGLHNRHDAWLAVQTAHQLTHISIAELVDSINRFPGLSQRMEELAPHLYSNYAHTPEKIKGGMSAAIEIAKSRSQNLVVIYEPLTNRRQHYIKEQYDDSFAGASKLYWVPTYLAREDPDLALLTPDDLIQELDDPTIAEAAEIDNELLRTIRRHLQQGDMVVAMGASGAGSLDEWLRENLHELV